MKKNKTIKVVYLTIGEILNAPLLRRQILELLAEVKRLEPGCQITVISVLPLHTYINHLGDNKITRTLLKQDGISFRVLPTLVPCPLPNIGLMKTDKGYRPDMRWTKLATRVLGITMLPVFIYYFILRRVRIFHCRSYPSAYAATFAKRLFSSMKVVFDPRSDFPEENITAGNWSSSDSNYLYWKEAEVKMLKNSNAVACISPSQLLGFKKDVPDVNGFVVPNNVDCKMFERNIDNRITHRKQLGFTDKNIVLCYIGDITSGGWHRVDLYTRACEILANLDERCRLLFLVPETGAVLLKQSLSQTSVADKVVIVSPLYESVSAYLSAADYGLMFLHKRKNAVGTKIGEYLAAGLPVIVNQNCLGAAELVNENNVGHVVGLGLGDLDSAVKPDLAAALKSDADLERWSSEVSGFARDYFDNKIIAQEYLKQYLCLK